MLQTEYDVVGECVCERNGISAPAVRLESGVVVCSMCSKRRPTLHEGGLDSWNLWYNTHTQKKGMRYEILANGKPLYL